MSSSQTVELDIEVTVKEGDTSTERGALLEKLAKNALLALQHEYVTTSVRVTGCELDVIAKDKQSGARVLVECKAYRDKAVSADVLTKMLGNLMIHDYSSAWLITTSKLGKDARGIVNSFQDKTTTERQRLRVYDPPLLIELLVSTGQICDYRKINIPDALHALPSRTLMITDIGIFWAVSAVGGKSGIADTVMVFDSQTGAQISNAAIVSQLAERDSNLSTLHWISAEEELATSILTNTSLKLELDNIAPVPVADDWSDYRPARPEDFVGRDEILKNIINFFDEVRMRKSKTRLLAIKAPSGWGKSSFLVKLRATCTNIRNREKTFLYAVDCRTATSSRYPELALKRCLDEAIRSGFVNGINDTCRITSSGQPFSDTSVQSILEQLRNENKVIVLFFDQFEEITTKQELSDLFLQIKMLCSAVESANENIVLGFSWKTDGSIPADHPAYHVWHSFADRRKEFDLPLFSKKDTGQLLGRLSNELQQPIEPSLKRLLSEHCQGYPWLLKKLCVHVFQVLQTQPARQRELLERALDVEALFKKDLSDLDAIQIACLEQIAKDSPADHFRIIESFGEPTVSTLMQLRLVVRSSGKLVVYWDIFRDYVLKKQVPSIPMQYIPGSSPGLAKAFLPCLTSRSNTLLSDISIKLNLKNSTLDNIARDLVMIGICQYDRKNAKIKLIHSNERDTLAAGHRFFSSHALLRRLLDQFGVGFRGISLKNIEATIAGAFNSKEYTKKTIEIVTTRLVSWLQVFGIVTIDVDETLNHNQSNILITEYAQLSSTRRKSRDIQIFKGTAPPNRVIETLKALQNKNYKTTPQDRNSLYALKSLGIISSTTEPKLLSIPDIGNEDIFLLGKVILQPSIRACRALLKINSNATSIEIGEAISKLNPSLLSEASKQRYGSGLFVWVSWIHKLIIDKTGEY